MPDQQQETLKVYELAKELGLDSFALLDKLKQFNIEVKSHMSSLAMEQAEAIRDAIKKEKRPAASGAGAVKKRTAAASAPAGATAAPAPAKKSPRSRRLKPKNRPSLPRRPMPRKQLRRAK